MDVISGEGENVEGVIIIATQAEPEPETEARKAAVPVSSFLHLRI